MEKLGAPDLLDLIIGGDFNLTLATKETWGKNDRGDTVGPFFTHLFDQKGLIDLAPLKPVPTWRNKREGEKAISKRLDRFLISENLIRDDLIMQSTVETGGNSEHRPIVLTVRTSEVKPPSPFKFKPQWLAEEEYQNMILEAWEPLQEVQNHSLMQQFADNLDRAKRILKEWDEKYRKRQEEEMRHVERQIKDLYENNVARVFMEAEEGVLKKLEGKKDSLLLQEE